MVITSDSDSGNPGSIPGTAFFFFAFLLSIVLRSVLPSSVTIWASMTIWAKSKFQAQIKVFDLGLVIGSI